MIRKKQNKQSGFTLVELLVTIAIFAMFITLASSSLVNVLKMEQKVNVLRQTQTDARYILETIEREARGANGELDAKGMRVVHAYSIMSDTGNTCSLSSVYCSINIFSTDLFTNTATQVVYTYYSATNILVRSVYTKSIGGNYPLTPTSSSNLNNPNDLKITGFTAILAPPSADFSIPPFLKNIDLKAESAQGIGAVKTEYRAAVEFQTSVTPRNY